MDTCKMCGGTVSKVGAGLYRCDFCGKTYSFSNNELNDANLEEAYKKAKSLLNKGDVQSLKEASDIFQGLGTYSDSLGKADECHERIHKIQLEEEERKLLEQRKIELEKIEKEKILKIEEEERKKRSIIIIIALIVGAIIIGGIVVYNSKQKEKYETAVLLYEEQKYEEALDIFMTVKGVSEADNYIKECNQEIKNSEKIYKRGIGEYERENYIKAIEEFKTIIHYSDSMDYIDLCAAELLNQAEKAYQETDYFKVRDCLVVIPEESETYVKSYKLLTEVEPIVTEMENASNYEKAVEAYNNKEYEQAHQIFIDLGTYNDSREYLNKISSMYYEKACELLNEENYAEYENYVSKIDSIEKWDNYEEAEKLKNEAILKYQTAVIAEAKQICRKDGAPAMMEFVHSKKSSLLSDEDAERIKVECDVKTIELLSLDPYTSGAHKLYGQTSVEDTLGNIYSEALKGASSKGGTFGVGECSLTFFIDKQYTCLSATVAVRKNDFGITDTAIGTIRIYGDDRLLWSDENIRKDTKPYDIEVDITGVSDLKIEMYGDENMGNKGIIVLLCEPKLSE